MVYGAQRESKPVRKGSIPFMKTNMKIIPLYWEIDPLNPNPERYRCVTWFGTY